MERVEALIALSDRLNITAARIDEAYRAQSNICHSGECGVLGAIDMPGDPETCYQGYRVNGLPLCQRIFQYRRIRYLDRRHAALLKKWRAA